MNNMTRTLTYVVAAIIMAGLAYWKGMPAPELNVSDFSDTGKEYYPEFDNPNEATGIRVVTFDEKTSDIKPFEVQFKNGLWKIPSHYDYPVDGEEQLAKTAASLVGVKRGAVAGESELDFKRLGVVDPLTDDETLKEFSGDRLTLTKGETVLVDLIIGKPVPDRDGFYYVRKPDEKLTYVAELDIDLSTKFSDWIEPDLLKLDQSKLRKIDVRDYSVDEQRGAILISDYFELNRKSASDSWVMEVYDPQTKKLKETITTLKTSELNGMINSLGDLKIAGVRPKPSFISSSLKLSGEVKPSREASLFLQQRGFFFAQSPDRKSLEIFSNQGDLTATTEEGVSYVLRFGAVFTGDEFDIEVGSAKPKQEKKEDEDKKEEEGEESKDSEGKNKSRYLFVSVQFDQSALGDPPVKPTPPPVKKKEEEKKKPEAEKKPETEKSADKKEKAASEEKKEEKEKADEQPDPQKEYEAALARYESDLKAYQEKIEAGKKEVEKLNKRFADWYYVIDAASFDKLHKSRADLVEVKEPEEKESTEPSSKTKTEEKPKKEPAKVTPEKPTTPPTTPKKGEKKAEPVQKKEEKPAGDNKPASKPASSNEKKPAEVKKSSQPPASKESKPKETPKTEKKPAS